MRAEPKSNAMPVVAGNHYDRTMFTDDHRRYYDDSGFFNFGCWDQDISTPKAACERLMERLLARVPADERQGPVLDVACGAGSTTAWLAQHFGAPALTGINISDKQLTAARTRVPGARFQTMDAARLEFAEHDFQHVFCVEAAFHFRTREAFLREVLRVLRPGGRLVLSDILLTRLGERYAPMHLPENYLAHPGAYEAMLTRLGYAEIRIEDTLSRSAQAAYAENVIHLSQRFRHGDMALAAYKTSLGVLLGALEHTRHYLLVSARKPASGQATAAVA